MKASIILYIAASLVLSTMAFAAAPEGKAEGPCKQIKQACLDAGFQEHEAKAGYGLWRDCINPVMQGKTTVAGSTKALPTVDPSLIAQCKKKDPNFGTGKVGSKAK